MGSVVGGVGEALDNFALTKPLGFVLGGASKLLTTGADALEGGPGAAAALRARRSFGADHQLSRYSGSAESGYWLLQALGGQLPAAVAEERCLGVVVEGGGGRRCAVLTAARVLTVDGDGKLLPRGVTQLADVKSVELCTGGLLLRRTDAVSYLRNPQTDLLEEYAEHVDGIARDEAVWAPSAVKSLSDNPYLNALNTICNRLNEDCHLMTISPVARSGCRRPTRTASSAASTPCCPPSRSRSPAARRAARPAPC